MSDFNISSWKKNQYLDQAGLLSEATLPMPSFFYKMWEIISKDLDKQAVASGDRMSYFSAEFPTASSFERYMRRQLEGSQLNEAPGSTLNLSKDDMDKLHKDGKLEIDGHKLLFKVKESVNEEKDIPAFLEKLAQDLKNKYPELKFVPKSDKIYIGGDYYDKQDFADENRNKDWGNGFTTFDVDDDDMGYIVRITRVNRL